MERLTERDSNGDVYVKQHDYVKASERLAEYEDAEENGLLLRLPCEIGQTVYVLAECGDIAPMLDGTLYGEGGGAGTATGYYCPYDLYDNCPHTCYECDEAADKTAVFEDTVTAISYDEIGLTIYTEYTVSGHIGEYIFLTREEAEKALAERIGKQ